MSGPSASSGGASSNNDIEADGPDEGAEQDSGDDEALEGFFDQLEHERGQWHGIEGIKLKDFAAKIRGGESEVAAGRKRFDAWQGQVTRRSDAAAWCIRNGFQQTMKFSLTLGDDEALTLATAWAERMQYMYDADQEGLLGSPDMVEFTMSRFRESAGLVELAARGDATLTHEINRVRSIVPH